LSEIEKELSLQLNREYYSAYLYLAMSNYCSQEGYNGAARWLFVQYKEETTHAMKIYNFLTQRDFRVELHKIDEPPATFESLNDIFKQTLEHEQFMTDNLNNLSDLAMKAKDHATYNFLQWFVEEQVEEEANVKDILTKLKFVGNDGQGLLMLDNELGARVFENTTGLNPEDSL